MKATIRDSETLRTIRPLDVVSYLTSRGWREVDRVQGGAFWLHAQFGDSSELLVPLDPGLRDYPARASEMLRVLEEVEGRSQLEILEDFTYQNADVIRPRLPGTQGDGTITIEQGMVLHTEARELLLAAACAAINPRAVYAARRPDEAMEYLKRARFGQSKRGSYIMTIISPVAPRIKNETDLFGQPVEPVDAIEPFERTAVRKLVSGLQAIRNACQQGAGNGQLDAMRSAVQQGVSANLCEAIVGMHKGGGERGVEFAFTWSASRPAPAELPTGVTILPDAVPIIEETARVFRATETFDNSEVIGTVLRLQHIAGEQGDVTVFGVAEGQQRTVHIKLSGADHSKAVQAYESRETVTCKGRLIKEGRSWVMINAHDFAIVATLFDSNE